jgi:ribonuclease BN (tRNA processing enzyme)
VHPVPLEKQEIEVRDLPAGEIQLDGVRVATRRQDRHSAPSLAFRFDDELAWITDTAYDPESARFAAGCELLAHEAWYVSTNPRNEDIHTSAAQAGKIAADAGVERLLLIHLPPFEESVDGLVAEARASAPFAELAREGMGVAVFVP